MALFSKLDGIEYDPEEDKPDARQAIAASEAYNAEMERKEKRAQVLPVPGSESARLEKGTPRGAELARMARTPPEFGAEQQAMFLDALADVPHIELAAFKAGVLVSTVNKLRRESPDFEAVVQMAMAIAGGLAEQEAWRRAVKGYLKPVWYQGASVGTETVFDSALHAKILEAHVPAFERKSSLKVDGKLTVDWLQLRQALESRGEGS